MLDHYAKLDLEAAGRLVQLVELSPLHYYGNPTPEEEAQMAGFGTVLVHRPLAEHRGDRGAGVVAAPRRGRRSPTPRASATGRRSSISDAETGRSAPSRLRRGAVVHGIDVEPDAVA